MAIEREDYSGLLAQVDEVQGLINSQSKEERLPTLDEVEKAHIIRVLDAVGWNISRARKVLDIGRNTLYQKIKKYHLEAKVPKKAAKT